MNGLSKIKKDTAHPSMYPRPAFLPKANSTNAVEINPNRPNATVRTYDFFVSIKTDQDFHTQDNDHSCL